MDSHAGAGHTLLSDEEGNLAPIWSKHSITASTKLADADNTVKSDLPSHHAAAELARQKTLALMKALTLTSTTTTTNKHTTDTVVPNSALPTLISRQSASKIIITPPPLSIPSQPDDGPSEDSDFPAAPSRTSQKGKGKGERQLDSV